MAVRATVKKILTNISKTPEKTLTKHILLASNKKADSAESATIMLLS